MAMGVIIIGLIMVEKGVWKMARQDCLHIPMSPALRVEFARLVTRVQDLDAAAETTETPDAATAALTVDDTRAAIQQVVDHMVDVAGATDTCPDEGQRAFRRVATDKDINNL